MPSWNLLSSISLSRRGDTGTRPRRCREGRKHTPRPPPPPPPGPPTGRPGPPPSPRPAPRPRGRGDREALGPAGAPQPDRRPRLGGRQVAAAAIDEAHLAAGRRLDLDAGADGVAVAAPAVADQFQPQPAVGRLRAVAQQRDRA